MSAAASAIEMRLAALRKAIVLKKLEMGLLELRSERLTNISDAAWLTSIADGFLGTLLAVMSGRHARPYDEHIASLQEEIARLQARILILEEALVVSQDPS